MNAELKNLPTLLEEVRLMEQRFWAEVHANRMANLTAALAKVERLKAQEGAHAAA